MFDTDGLLTLVVELGAPWALLLIVVIQTTRKLSTLSERIERLSAALEWMRKNGGAR